MTVKCLADINGQTEVLELGMAESFLVEFRLRGYARKYAKGASDAFSESQESWNKKAEWAAFRITYYIIRCARTSNWKWLASEVERIGLKYTLVPLKIQGLVLR